MSAEKRIGTFQGLPVVTAAQMRELDRAAGERHGLSTLSLMENAGRSVAAETIRFLRERLGLGGGAWPVVICCGRGGKGGDGLVAARALKEGGARVSVFLCPPRTEAGGTGAYPEPVRINLERARAAGVSVVEAGPESGLREGLARAVVAVDALLGTGSSGQPSGAIHHMIEELGSSGKPVLSIDLPSGLDPDTGERGGACVQAAATFTLGLAKRGLLAPRARKFVGELKVLDIGLPKELLKGLGRA